MRRSVFRSSSRQAACPLTNYPASPGRQDNFEPEIVVDMILTDHSSTLSFLFCLWTRDSHSLDRIEHEEGNKSYFFDRSALKKSKKYAILIKSRQWPEYQGSQEFF